MLSVIETALLPRLIGWDKTNDLLLAGRTTNTVAGAWLPFNWRYTRPVRMNSGRFFAKSVGLLDTAPVAAICAALTLSIDIRDLPTKPRDK